MQGAGFQELKNDQAVMKMEALGDGLETAQGKGLPSAGVVEIGAEAVGELSGEGLFFGEFAADGKGISNDNADGVALCQCGRIVEAIGVGGEIDAVIVAKGGKISDPGDSAVGIIAMIVLVGDERADRIRVAAEHGLPSAKCEKVKRNETQAEVQEQREKHQPWQKASDAPGPCRIGGRVVHSGYFCSQKMH